MEQYRQGESSFSELAAETGLAIEEIMRAIGDVEHLRREEAAADFARLAAQAAREALGPEPSDEEVAEAVRRTREAYY